MESATTDQCSWCHRELSSGAQADTDALASAEETSDAPGVEEALPDEMASSMTEVASDTDAGFAFRPAPRNATHRVLLGDDDSDASAPPVRSGTGSLRAPAPGTPPARAGRGPAPGAPIPSRGSGSLDPSRVGGKAPLAPVSALPATARRDAGEISAPVAQEITPVGATAATAESAPKSRTTRLAVPAALLENNAAQSGSGSLSATVAPPPTRNVADATQAMPASARPAQGKKDYTPEPLAVEADPNGLAGGRSAPVRTPSPSRLPNMDMQGTQPSKYYSNVVVDPVSGKQIDPITGSSADASATKPGDVVLNWDDPGQVNYSAQVTRYLGIFAGILVVAGILARVLPAFFAIPMVVAIFVGAMLMPVMRVVPWQDEDSDDVLIYLLLTLIFGPAISLVVYGVLAAIRQAFNPAILGMLIVTLLARVITALAAGSPTLRQLAPWQIHSVSDWPVVLLNWSGLVAMAGWYTAGFFHKLDE